MAGDSHPSSTHPPLPPTTEDIRFSHLRLLRSRRVGASTYHRLLNEHGNARDALAALPEIARSSGVRNYSVCPEGVVAAELEAGDRIGARLLIHGHDGYPEPLLDLADAPPPPATRERKRVGDHVEGGTRSTAFIGGWPEDDIFSH